MDVGIVTAPLDLGPSGPGVYLENLCLALQDLGNDDLELHLIHHQESSSEIYRDANDVILPRAPGRFEGAVSRLDLDVLHYNYIPYKRPLVFGLDVPIVVTLHGDLQFALPEYAPLKSRYIAKPVLWLYAKLGVLDRIDHFVPVSESVGNTLASHLAIPDRKITTVYSGVGDRFKPVSGASSAIQSQYSVTTPYLLNVNNYMEKKNRTTLLRAFSEIASAVPELTLVLAGGGWKHSNIPSLITKLGIEDSVVNLGYVPDADLPKLYSAAEMVVNPTLHETFGFTNVEAMACGTPVITSRRFAVPEIVGDSAVLVDDPLDADALASAIIDLHSDGSRRAALAKRGQRRASEFSWDRTAEQMNEIYGRTVE